MKNVINQAHLTKLHRINTTFFFRVKVSPAFPCKATKSNIYLLFFKKQKNKQKKQCHNTLADYC